MEGVRCKPELETDPWLAMVGGCFVISFVIFSGVAWSSTFLFRDFQACLDFFSSPHTLIARCGLRTVDRGRGIPSSSHLLSSPPTSPTACCRCYTSTCSIVIKTPVGSRLTISDSARCAELDLAFPCTDVALAAAVWQKTHIFHATMHCLIKQLTDKDCPAIEVV